MRHGGNIKRFLLELLLGRDILNEIIMCLQGAKYCMTHDVAYETKEFELEHIKEILGVLKRR